MKRILLFGAGKSATCLIDYLVKEISVHQWELVVAESNLTLAQSKIGGAPAAKAVAVQVENSTQRDGLIKEADIVISLLPPALHILIAQSCIREGRNLLTASYMDNAIRDEAGTIREKGLLFLYEMGLDPGIDHMSAMQLIHRIQSRGGKIHSFKSHTGGLVAPSSDDNPWHYKISWNPRNVVLAGSAGAVFKENRQIVNRSYRELFKNCGQVDLEGVGELAWYPNRDSLSYIPLYGLEETATFIRTTLRYGSFCEAWAAIVDAGLTDDKTLLRTEGRHFKDWSEPVRPYINDRNKFLLEFLGLFDELPLPAGLKSSADVLQYLMETKLAMQSADKDLIAMLHELEYTIDDRVYGIRSSLVVEGADPLRTAMAKTVGLPLGIAAKLILEGKISVKGLQIPILPEIYLPVLEELAGHGVQFAEAVH
jgi:saccharopine dehydrogenase-like NADP-dependent oxidoreductase